MYVDAVLPGAGYIAMAIEAVARIFNETPEPPIIKGFSLRDVIIKKSLTIPEDDYGIEVLTSLELADVDTAKSPAWAAFSISSVGRETDDWIEHSTGLVKVEIGDDNNVVDDVVHLDQVASGGSSRGSVPRGVDARAWYKKFLDVGLSYGPAFQPLSNIRSHPESNLALATVDLHPTSSTDPIKGGESTYPLHPASLDGAIQLGLIACHGGRCSAASTAFVPVRLPHLYLANDITGNACTVAARGEKRGLRAAYLDLQMLGPNGEILLSVDNLRCIGYSRETKPVDNAFSSPFTRLAWRPDIRMLSNRQAHRMHPPPKENVDKSRQWGLTNKLAHFVVLSIYESYGKLQDGPKPSGDIGHFFAWIKRKGQNDHSDLMEEARQLASNGRLLQHIEELVKQAADIMEVKIAKLLHDNMADILYERRTGMDVILSKDLLTPLYQSGLLMTGIYPQLLHVLSGIAHSSPNLRVLEIGGGTGGATRIAMKAFNGPNGIKAYRDYTFTDISPGFLSSARESMADMGDMDFSVFDTEMDPTEQGFEQAYDLVIACQVLHATSNMHKTLSNCRKLLKPGGRIVLVETNQNFIVPGVVVGTFTGYWAGIPDGRVDAPFQDLDPWGSSLRRAGFSGLDIVLDDFPEPHNTTSVILSTALPEVVNQPASALIHVLHSARTAPPLVDQIFKELNQRGMIARTGSLENHLDGFTTGTHVIALFDVKHLMINASEQDVKIFQYLTRNAASFVALTSCGIVKGRNADGAVIPALLRVLGNENPASQFMSIDIDADNFTVEDDDRGDVARCIVDLEFTLHQDIPVDPGEGNPKDREFSWHDGCMWVSRHVPDGGFHSQHGLDSQSMKTELLPLGIQGAVKANFETPGVLNSLRFMPYKELLQSLPADFIDVAVAVVGVNSRDLDHWSGRLDGNNLSSEYTGIVTAIGARVSDLKIGDPVYGLGKGQFGNYTRVPAAFARKLRPGDDMVQMASMPLAYATAIYAFEHVANLRKGQSVLIQSGASDIGLASVCLARAKGAAVFAMAETTEQAKFLLDEVALPASHIISTPSLADLRLAAQKTPHEGFDVILSTAQGDYLHSSLQVLAPLGRLIDVGRGDVQIAPAINLESLQKNATYCSIEPFIILDSDPVLGGELMQAIDSYYRKGLIEPIQRITAPDIAQLSPLLGGFSSIIGKLVVSFENPESVVRMIPPAPTVNFDSESYYVITGALGGLGQSLIRWMSDQGARYLALISRRDIGSVAGAQETIKSLATRDIHIESFICDVSKKDQVMRVIQNISSSRPIKGIVHAAVSYLDLSFDKISSSRWNESLSAKVEGTKNLHEATSSMSLDFFVMTTSALSVYSFATQGAYTAANNFQDAFARYRRRLGLPASTISFSLIQEVTDVGTDDTTVDLFNRNKATTLGESQLLPLLEPAFLDNKTANKTNSEQWPGQWRDPLSASNLHTFLNPKDMVARRSEEIAGEAPSSATIPRWYSDGRVSLMMRAFLDAQRQSAHLQGSLDEGSKNTVVQLRGKYDAAVQEGATGRTHTVALVKSAIINVVAEMLFVDAEGIDPAKSVADLGVDSLIASELRNWFHQALGTNISMLDLLDPNVGISTRAEDITDKALTAKA